MQTPEDSTAVSLAPSGLEHPAAAASKVVATPERISILTGTLLERLRESIREIGDINFKARLLALNAQIEAARAGEAGLSFAVLGKEMVGLSASTQQASERMQQESEKLVLELAEISRQLATNVRGTRLADLALTNIDLIDRNLYERSCDCRWWATDAALVAALDDPGDATASFASSRLGVILKAYTVYFDIVLANRDGRIIANGRPEENPSQGSRHATATWFTSALASGSGDEFGFESVHPSPLVHGKRVLVYSCKVCRGGDAHGETLGVLGVIFNWDGLAQKIVHETPIETEKKAVTRVCIVDDAGTVLADSEDRMLQEPLEFSGRDKLFALKKGSAVMEVSSVRSLAAHAQSPGFETYRTGWHSLIIEKLAK
jgi:hypothetical protein